MVENFWDKVQERAYYKYLNRKSVNLPESSESDWEEAKLEQIIQDKIEEEAYLHFLNGCNDPDKNWIDAEREIKERIGFIAFYNHENNINKSAVQNWIEAQKIYAENF